MALSSCAYAQQAAMSSAPVDNLSHSSSPASVVCFDQTLPLPFPLIVLKKMKSIWLGNVSSESQKYVS